MVSADTCLTGCGLPSEWQFTSKIPGVHTCTIMVLHPRPNWAQISRWKAVTWKATVVKPAVYNTYKRCRSRMCIQWQISVQAILAIFIYFSYLFYLGHLSPLALLTKTRRQSNSSTFCSFKSQNPVTFMSSMASAFVHATHKRSQKVPCAKGGTFWFP